MYFLTVERNKLVVKYPADSGGEITRVVHSTTDWIDFCRSRKDVDDKAGRKFLICASSTVHFPEDYTSNKDTIALCRAMD